MRGAQQSLLIALELRRDGLERIAEQIRTALGDEGEAADEAITRSRAQMQVFLASDVVYAGACARSSQSALEDDEIGGQDDRGARAFLPGHRVARSPSTVAADARPAAVRERRRAAADEPTGARPARHGHRRA